MSYLMFFLFLFVISITLANVEIAIEGPNGWAQLLPTWRLPADHWISKLFFGGRPADGYHTWLELFLIAVFHSAYAFVPPTAHIELLIIAFFCFFCVTEDFAWFVCNPAFGIKRFRKQHIWWHAKQWWWFAPRDYFIFTTLGVLMLWIAAWY